MVDSRIQQAPGDAQLYFNLLLVIGNLMHNIVIVIKTIKMFEARNTSMGLCRLHVIVLGFLKCLQ